MPQQRQLAAIIFTDIVGYTALMGSDEQRAMDLLYKNRELQKPIIEEFNGRWIKELGDGVLASFPTVSDAVLAAIKIQEQSCLSNEFRLRIGIHHGEVMFEENDVFGDAVNIASRLQALAPVGGIWISESVHQNVVNKNEIRTRFIKEIRLKNVKNPVRVYEILLNKQPGSSSSFLKRAVSTGKTTNSRRAFRWILGLLLLLVTGYFLFNSFIREKKNAVVNAETDRSIAVLPFVNLSNDKEQEYFSDGLSEELLNLLAKTPGLKVIARTSSFAFKGKNEDIRTISEILGVAHVLEGSVQKEGNHIRVKAQLIRASDGVHIWSEKYDRQIEDIFKLQDDIALSVVKELRLRFLENPTAISTSTEAYNLLLQGNYFQDKLDKENVQKAQSFYLKALAIDSMNAYAWALLARNYSRQAWQNYTDQRKGYEQARAASLRSIALNDRLAAGYNALGGIKMYIDFDWKGADSCFQKALEREPGNADVVNNISVLHQIKGEWDLAIDKMVQALRLDPLKPIFYSNQGANMAYKGLFVESNAHYKKVLELNPQFQRAHMYLGRNYLLQGKKNEALVEMEQEPIPVFRTFGLALAYHSLGKKKEAEEKMQEFVENYQGQWAYLIAEMYAFCNKKDLAFQWLDTAWQRRDSWLVWIKGDPLLKTLENDPRYRAILQNMNLQD